MYASRTLDNLEKREAITFKNIKVLKIIRESR